MMAGRSKSQFGDVKNVPYNMVKMFSVNYAVNQLYYTRDKVELESSYKASCELCCATCNRRCEGCRLTSVYKGLRDGFDVAEMVATRKARDVVKV